MTTDSYTKSWHDMRGNKWTKTTYSKKDQNFLNTVRKNWNIVSDDDIANSKKIVCDIFSDNYNLKGTPYVDFIYMFSNDKKNHYFIQTNIYEEPLVYKYEGECDIWHFSDSATFDMITLM